jgi:hypothetical protein
VADDDEGIRQRIAKILAADYDVIALVENGRQLVEMARALAADLAIVDISMPVLKGAGSSEATKNAQRPDEGDFFHRECESSLRPSGLSKRRGGVRTQSLRSRRLAGGAKSGTRRKHLHIARY